MTITSDEGNWYLVPDKIILANDRDFTNLWVTLVDLLNFSGENILSTRDQHFIYAITDIEISLFV